MNMEFEKKLALPGEVQEDNPLTAEMEQNIADKRKQVKDIFLTMFQEMLKVIQLMYYLLTQHLCQSKE